MDILTPLPLFWPKDSSSAPLLPGWPERMRARMRLAARYAVIAGQSEDLPALQQEACQVAADGLQAGFATLLAYQADDHDFLVQAGVGWRPGVVGRSRVQADTGTAAGLAWLTGEPAVCNALAQDTRFRALDLLTEHGVVRSVSVPVPGDGSMTFGVLEVESSRHGEFHTDDICFVQLLAYSLATARGRLTRQASCGAAEHQSSLHEASLHEMQHRFRNDLQGIYSSISREIRGLDDASQRAGYNRVSRRVLALAGLYDHLLGLQADDGVEMAVYLGSLCHKIAAATDLASRGIVLATDMQPVGMTVERAGRLAVAVNELVANAAEHAFPDGVAGTITVRLFARGPDGTGCPVIVVSDDGCGFKGMRPGSAGLGYVERLVRGAGGVLTRLEGAGTEWRIALRI